MQTKTNILLVAVVMIGCVHKPPAIPVAVQVAGPTGVVANVENRGTGWDLVGLTGTASPTGLMSTTNNCGCSNTETCTCSLPGSQFEPQCLDDERNPIKCQLGPGISIAPVYPTPKEPIALELTASDVVNLKLEQLRAHVEDLESNQETLEALIVWLESRISELEDLTKFLKHKKDQ